MNTSSYLIISVTVLFLSSCASTIHRRSNVSDVETLSLDAKQRVIAVSEKGGWDQNKRVYCAEPSPDALVAQAAAISGNINTPKSVNAALASSLSEAASSIGLRTQTITILRDGYYRLCEAYLNGAISDQDYQKVLYGVDEFITVVAAVEAIGGIVKAPAVDISTQTQNTSADSKEAKTTGGTPAVIVTGAVQSDTLATATQADAIAQIVDSYLAHKREALSSYGKQN